MTDNYKLVFGKWYYSPYQNANDKGDGLTMVIKIFEIVLKVGNDLIQQNVSKDEFITKLKSALPPM